VFVLVFVFELCACVSLFLAFDGAVFNNARGLSAGSAEHIRKMDNGGTSMVQRDPWMPLQGEIAKAIG